LRKRWSFKYRLLGLQTDNQKRTSAHHIIVKTLGIQNKEELKAAREKHQASYKVKPTRIISYCSAEILKAKKAWNDVFQVQKENNCHLILLHPTKPSFIIEGEIKAFHDKQKQKQFMVTKLELHKVL
jgi:hypothetical protein